MSASKLVRIASVGMFIASGYVGCKCNPPPNNPPGEQACINPPQESIPWAFIDKACGCKTGDVKCAYEAQVMDCLKKVEVRSFDCANLPPIHKAADDQGKTWQVLYLESLRLPPETGQRLVACLEQVNKQSGKVGGHLLKECRQPAAASVQPRVAPVQDGGPIADGCGSDGCLLPGNTWSTCDKDHPCE